MNNVFFLHLICVSGCAPILIIPCVLPQALNPLGIGVATGESCQNRVMFKQFLQAKALQYCQIDAGRLAGPSELVAVVLMAAKFGGESNMQVYYLI